LEVQFFKSAYDPLFKTLAGIQKMKKLTYILILFSLISLNQKAFGTAQIPDFLIYEGDTLSIYANPLESYFENHPRPDKVFQRYGYNSTACWRGYIGYWELSNDSLFLVELQGDSTVIDLSLVFKDRKTDKKIHADWCNSSLLNPYGKLIHYEHMGYGSIYEYEKKFEFTNGILKGIVHFDNSKSRKSKFTQDNKLLRDYIIDNTNHSLIPDSVKIAKVFVQIISVTPEGKIDSVIIRRGFNKDLDEEARRVVKSIPDWDVLYRQGEPYNLLWNIPVVFKKKKKVRPANKP